MKLLEEKRDELAEQHYKTTGWVSTEFAVMNFHAGWDACAKEYEKEIAELKEELKIWEIWHEGFEASILEATKEDLENLIK